MRLTPLPYQVLYMSAQPTGKIEELESIRGIAALLVVLFHVPAWNPLLHDIRLFLNSYYMVDLFFVLSGFVMNLNYGNRLHSARDLARFQFLRLGRLYPVHVLFLLLAVLTTASSWIAVTAFGLNMPNGAAFKDVTLGDFTAQLLLVHSLGFFKIAHPFNLPSWSISVEFYTYLVFGLLCLISHYVLRLSTFIVLAGAALVLLALGGETIGNFSEILQCLAGYFLGCLVASSRGTAPARAAARQHICGARGHDSVLVRQEESAVRYRNFFAVSPAHRGGGLQQGRLHEADSGAQITAVPGARFLFDLHVAYARFVGL